MEVFNNRGIKFVAYNNALMANYVEEYVIWKNY